MVNGHFLNWYDTRSSTPLPPFFISSVDSGNLVCSLLSLKQGCLAAVDQPISVRLSVYQLARLLGVGRGRNGRDRLPRRNRKLPSEPCAPRSNLWAKTYPRWIEALPRLQESVREAALNAPDSWWLQEAHERFLDVRDLLETLVPWLLPEFSSLRSYFDDMILPKVIGQLTIQAIAWLCAKIIDAGWNNRWS